MLFTQTVSAPPSHAVTEVSGARYHFLFFLSPQFALKQSKAGILWLTHLGVQGPTGRRAGALPSSSLAGARGGGGAKSPRPATRPSSLTRRADGADTGPNLPKRCGPSRPPPPGADRTVPAGRGSPGHVAGRAQQSGTHGAGRGERGGGRSAARSPRALRALTADTPLPRVKLGRPPPGRPSEAAAKVGVLPDCSIAVSSSTWASGNLPRKRK